MFLPNFHRERKYTQYLQCQILVPSLFEKFDVDKLNKHTYYILKITYLKNVMGIMKQQLSIM